MKPLGLASEEADEMRQASELTALDALDVVIDVDN
jgi:hypothetical protein